MRSNDIKSRDEIRAQMQRAIAENDTDAFYQSFDQMLERIQADIQADYDQRIGDMQQEIDARILSARGVRQLTQEERTYYKALAQAMRDRDPKQAVSNLDVAMPQTVIDAVLEELQTEHPLLSHINFTPTGGALKILVNTNGEEKAAWGTLSDEIVKELTGGLRQIDVTLMKLSAFLPVCKAMLDLGPQWLDRFVRETLYEALANGMEYGIIAGDGAETPIGMIRQVGAGVTVTDGAYPAKSKIEVNSLDVTTVGKLLGLLAVNNGKARRLSGIILICNPADYFTKVMPATTLMAPDGSYRNDVLPYPMTVIQSAAVDVGEAVFGIGKRYRAFAGMASDGRIEYSDHYHFLEDERVYLIKTYAYGLPMDNNSFLHLDISNLRPATWKVEQVAPAAASDDATLSSLKIGSLSLTPAFDALTDTYTASTTAATNTITAVPADAAASVEIKVNDDVIANGTAATWNDGSNTVEITVTAEDGTTTGTYLVTVTKS